ncbi:hypothetical protein B296_00027205 [Ensete ventricosum]|uniref:Uncharacterized protein n=1 Tax=Ensete ventricosum TaxID=4639 RepID=A0A426X9W7_ENSVE|nr:hypothetical protein B296_00027205 [Ensete ventricosum]
MRLGKIVADKPEAKKLQPIKELVERGGGGTTNRPTRESSPSGVEGSLTASSHGDVTVEATTSGTQHRRMRGDRDGHRMRAEGEG